MTGRTARACLLLAWMLRNTIGIPEVQVTCRVSEDCALPCTFEPGGGEEVRWYLLDALIYSHPDGGRLGRPSVGGASVSAERLALGDASLLLHGCGPRSRGRYRCRVIGGGRERDSFVVVHVEAPIRSVHIQTTRLSGYEEVKCSTSGVYPAPRVSWSTHPPTPPEKLRYTTRKAPDGRGRYGVESKLETLYNTDLTYICTLNSSATRQAWRAYLAVTVLNNVTSTSSWQTSYTWADVTSAEGQNLTIPCEAPWDVQDFTVTWTFTGAEETTSVCTYDSRADLITNHWRNDVVLELRRVRAGDASLRLLNPRRPEHTGVYACNISALRRAHVGRVGVNITSEGSENKSNIKNSATQWWIPALAVALLAILAAFIIGMVKLRGRCKHTGNRRDSRETKVTDPENEGPSEGIRLTTNQSSEHT